MRLYEIHKQNYKIWIDPEYNLDNWPISIRPTDQAAWAIIVDPNTNKILDRLYTFNRNNRSYQDWMNEIISTAHDKYPDKFYHIVPFVIGMHEQYPIGSVFLGMRGHDQKQVEYLKNLEKTSYPKISQADKKIRAHAELKIIKYVSKKFNISPQEVRENMIGFDEEWRTPGGVLVSTNQFLGEHECNMYVGLLPNNTLTFPIFTVADHMGAEETMERYKGVIYQVSWDSGKKGQFIQCKTGTCEPNNDKSHKPRFTPTLYALRGDRYPYIPGLDTVIKDVDLTPIQENKDKNDWIAIAQNEDKNELLGLMLDIIWGIVHRPLTSVK